MNQYLVWIRRDLRLDDHTALFEAMRLSKNNEQKQCGHIVFVFDTEILNKIINKKDQRVSFIMQGLMEIQEELSLIGCNLHILVGDPQKLIPKFCKEYKITDLFFNRDYENYAYLRDLKIKKSLKNLNVSIHNFKDHVIFEKHEVLTQKNEHYKVFTPYKNQWLKKLLLTKDNFKKFSIKETDLKFFLKENHKVFIDKDLYKEIGMESVSPFVSGGRKNALKKLKTFKKKIEEYKKNRDIPSTEGTSSLSPYIRHGMLSIREMLSLATSKESPGHQCWLNEIIWRDFYQMILAVFPHVAKECFKREYNQIIWPGKKTHFKKWCQGQTGVPIVDAAQRCLNETGTMPNRLRMVSASYLCKILLVDWKWGEEYFAQKLLDFDFAANNGGWQWCASTGCDAQPYFRIFNPYNQSRRFDPNGIFIRKYCPELSYFTNEDIHRPENNSPQVQLESQCIVGQHYPYPLENYESQRQKAILLFKNVFTLSTT